MTLEECPPGPFISAGGLYCIKTEAPDINGFIAAFVIESGDLFLGTNPSTPFRQRLMLVTPVALLHDDLDASK